MTIEEKIHYKDLFSKLSGIVLLLAVIPIWPYFFYQLIKFLVFGTAVYIAHLAYKGQQKGWMWKMIVIAVLFNPINPLYFGHFIWSVVDLIAAFLFFKAKKTNFNID